MSKPKQFDDSQALSDAAKSAISMIFNAPPNTTVKQVRRYVRQEYGRDVDRELESRFSTKARQFADEVVQERGL